jgi:hypothetical protein
MGKQEDEIIYNMKTAIAKREARKRHRERWNKFVNELETDITRPNPKLIKF